MSTRSGKRIHNSLHENDSILEATDNTTNGKTEKKSRSRGLQENTEGEKYACAYRKKKNYVAYPGNNDNDTDTVAVPVPRGKTRKSSKKNVLQEHDINEINIKEIKYEGHDVMKSGRLTRQTKKFNDVQDIENTENVYNKKNSKIICRDLNDMDSTNTTINKKLKKKKQTITHKANKGVDTEVTNIPKKTSKKKKKGKKTSTNRDADAVDIFVTEKTNKSLNKSGMSVDSFHSAAGSPASERDINHSTNSHSGHMLIAPTLPHNTLSPDEEISCNKSANKTRKCKTTIKGDVMENVDKQKYYEESQSSIKLDGTSDTNRETENVSVEACTKTYSSNVSKDSIINSLNEIIETVESSISATKQRRSKRLSHLDPDTPTSVTKHTNKINKTLSDKKQIDRTFENTPTKLDSTFDKQKENITLPPTNPDTTFDKSDEQITSKCSLISSDGELNSTYNKANDVSRISITSDESKAENIINTTPMLIESSLDNTQLEETPTNTDLKETEIVPLKREGTFTKDDIEYTNKDTSLLSNITNTSCDSVKVKTPVKHSLSGTPDKGTPLGTPGSTPFPFSKTSQKKSVLNITHSIEKSGRSSIVECAPRTTRVMFCSPVDFPLPATESKRRIVKSSVKGSNKSFVFDNSACGRPSPAQGRKRSFTYDENGQRAKRTRLADDLLHSVERLSRPRTSSATGKLGSSSKLAPGNKLATPPSRPRTKLPNFAALHQKQFAKMESLDECQDRKAKRAKQLLVPTGSVAVLDRSSPQAIDSPRKSKDPKTKKTDTVQKQGDTTLPSYTRFGFKMNLGGVVNPFSVPRKEPTTVVKPKEKNSNVANTRTTLPSRTGGTLLRKDVAKQIIMREKSFTSLSSKLDSKRTQNRTIIKGVRTNRRFELQMQMRNLDA